MDEDKEIKPVKVETVEESEVIMEETNGSLQQQLSCSSQRNSQNGSIRRGPTLEEGELMDQSGPSPDLEPVRPFTPPLRERTRSRSRERSAELQENLDQILRSETELKKENKAKDNDYLHNVYYINDIEAVELPKSVSQRISKVFGYIRYAVEAFENGSHVFYSSDNYEERRKISDYVRRKTIADYKSPSRHFIVVRNEFIVHERFGELSILHSGVCLVPLDADLHKLPDTQRCYLSTIETFRTFYLKFPGFFSKDDVFVFEDFQYFGDSSVGHFYEESLLVPPSNGQFIFLSTRIKNADELATWICKSEGNVRPIECITVLKRNGTLKHFISRQFERTMGEVIDENGEFWEAPFVEATKVTDKSKITEKKKDIDRQTLISKLVRTVLFRVPPPILIYSFDTEDIENTVNLLGQFGFNSETNQFMIEKIFNNEMKRLTKDDSELPEIKNLLPFLQRGIAPYHYGLFPILRKIIKVLFAKDLIRVIVGDNAILNETNFHFNGAIIMRDRYMIELGHYRWIKPSEYHEICERVDGNSLTDPQIPLAILINGDEDMPINVAKEIFTNNIPTLGSQLEITPTLVLLAIQSPILHEDYAFKKSFGRLRKIEHAKEIQSELRQKNRELEEFPVEEEEQLVQYQRELDAIKQLKAAIRTHKFKPTVIKKFMDIGRVVKIFMNNHDFGYGIIVKYNNDRDTIDVLLNVTKESYEAEDDKVLRPAENGLKNKIVVYRGRLIDVTVVTKQRLSIPPSLYNEEEFNMVEKHLNKMVENVLGEVPELELEHLGIKDEETIAKHEAILRREKELKDLEHRINSFNVNFARFEEKQKLEKEVDALENAYSEVQCSDAEEIQKKIFNLLGPFNYYDDAKENLSEKAEFAINLPVKENILLAELFFKQFFDDKSSREILLILSTFIEMEVTLERMNLTPKDKKLFEDFTNIEVQKFAHKLRKIGIIEHGQVLTYMKNFNASLFDFLDVWCKRLPFSAAIRQTDIRPGFVATYLERLHELLVSIIARAHLLPPHPEDGIDWYERFNELDTLLTRDIPFTTI